MALTEILVAAGAPVLKAMIADKFGGLAGQLAGSVLEALAKGLSTPANPVAPEPDAIADAFERDPVRGTAIVQGLEADAVQYQARIAEAQRDIMVGYQALLRQDQAQEGWIARNWRPMFAVIFTLCFAGIVLTICRAIWISQLEGVEAVAGLIITVIAAGCAVLGVQVWQRTEEKKAGV